MQNLKVRRKTIMNIDRSHVEAAFKDYTDHYDSTDPKVRLKIDHTRRVAMLADRIEQSEGRTSGIGWLTGMLHDIGRFEQLRRFHTFVDSRSVDHAELGADILFGDGLIRRFMEDNSKDGLLEKAIHLHNKLDLPTDLVPEEHFYCNVIRDADKIDILKVICETPFNDIYDCTPLELAQSPISDVAFQQIMEHKTIDRKISRTYMDVYLNKISFVFGLVFPESLRLIQEQGYLQQLLDFHSVNADTESKLQMIRSDVKDYLNRG